MLSLQAALGIANLIVMAMMESGVTQAEAREKIWMYDAHGLLVKVSELSKRLLCAQSYTLICCLFVRLKERTKQTDANQEAFVHDSPGDVQSFLDAVNTIKPTAIIGDHSFCFILEHKMHILKTLSKLL